MKSVPAGGSYARPHPGPLLQERENGRAGYWQTEDFLHQRNVPLNYSAADLADDDFAALAATSFRALDEEENAPRG